MSIRRCITPWVDGCCGPMFNVISFVVTMSSLFAMFENEVEAEVKDEGISISIKI
jgi:hypothetical protein